MNKSINTFFALSTILIFAGCSSLQITEEAVADQSVAGVSITSKSTATQAVLANAVVYFEYDQFSLSAKSIQALKGVSELMKRNTKITISIEGHADERGTREYNLALGQRRAIIKFANCIFVYIFFFTRMIRRFGFMGVGYR